MEEIKSEDIRIGNLVKCKIEMKPTGVKCSLTVKH